MLKAELLLQVIDSQGKLKRELKQPSRSFVRQFIQELYIIHSYTNYTVKDIANTDRIGNREYDFSFLMMISAGGDSGMGTGGVPQTSANARQYHLGDLYGIQIGTGAVAPDANNVALGTKIAHGAAATQMLYGGSEIERVSVAAPSASFLLRRYFTNKSGGLITVNEVGIYSPIFTGIDTGFASLMSRDVIPGGVAVANNELLRVQYTIQVTV